MMHGRKTARSVIIAAVAALGCAAAVTDELIQPQHSALRLRPAIVASDDALTLAEVLDFSAADAQLLAAIGDKSLSEKTAATLLTEVTHEQIVARLKELGVNLARVTISGSLRCRIEQSQAVVAADTRPAADEPPLVRPIGDLDAGEATTLAAIIREQVATSLSSLSGTVDVAFEMAGKEFLDLTSPPFELSVRGPRNPQLGLQEFSVVIRRDGKMQRTVRIGAMVKLTRKVVVAAKPINAGTFVRADSLTLADRTFNSIDEIGIEETERLIGQQATTFVPVGQMVRLRDIKSVDLVKRSQAVTVVGDGAIQLRLSGTALDSGGYGESVRISIGDKKGRKRELRGVVTGVATVRIAEEGSL
ncbi:MAG: flagellar basal body P-ring formation chaperone FlgA [Phycisphaerae bacterium]